MNYSSKVMELNPVDMPMCQTDFYKWMKEGGFCNHIVRNKVNYLRTRFGFVKGKDKIDADVLQTMRYIADHFFYAERAKKVIPVNNDSVIVQSF